MLNKFGFKKYIVDSLENLKFKSFTEVQTKVFNNFNLSNNLLVKSKTGSGKTHSFLLPIFNNLDESKYEVQAVIISPTKELAQQTFKVAQHIASFSSDTIDIRLYCGGSDRTREIERLKNSQPQIVIATPGKIHDLVVKENVLKIYTASLFVIDEVDMALESGYSDSIDQVAQILTRSKMMFFSATISNQVFPFIKKYLDNPIYINIEDDKTLNIEHTWIPIKHFSREEMLVSLTKIINPYLAIVFVNKKSQVEELVNKLKSLKFNVGYIHGDLTSRERKRILQEAFNLKYQYIVATDLAARGIDIDGVSHVINFDLPRDYEFYMHRTGRTGRMNYTGTVYTFYNELDSEYLDYLNKKGVVPIYREIKNGSLVEHKGRNSRQTRIRPLTIVEQKVKKIIKKPTRVSPGYKKKLKEEEDKLAKKIYKKAEVKKRKYYK
ncbi:MAG: DEAD/DEAH box helicase [Anaeroplasmataceae bacterium]